MILGRFRMIGYQLIDLIEERPILKKGAVVWCSLLFGSAEHNGIYVGKGKIVELSGEGIIREVTLSQFLNGDGLGYRTGINIYVICNGKGDVLFELHNSRKSKKYFREVKKI